MYLARQLLKNGVLLVVALAALGAQAQESGPLEATPGFSESVLGARVVSVEELAGRGERRVVVSVPVTSIKHKPDIEEVIVTAPYPEREVRWRPRFEFIKDYDRDHYGLVIYLGEGQNLPFRIFFSDPEAEQLRGQ